MNFGDIWLIFSNVGRNECDQKLFHKLQKKKKKNQFQHKKHDSLFEDNVANRIFATLTI